MTEVRYDRHGKLTVMVRSSRYLMVRRPSQFPFVLSKLDWQKLSLTPIERGAAVYPIVSVGNAGHGMPHAHVLETFPSGTAIESPPDGWERT